MTLKEQLYHQIELKVEAVKRVAELERTIEASPFLDAILLARQLHEARSRATELEKENIALRGIIANLQGEKP